MANLPEAVAVRSSPEHSCALTTAGDVYCWGRNNGELGTGNLVDSPVAIQTLNVANAVELVTGAHNAGVRTATDNVFSSGQNIDGKLGDLQLATTARRPLR